MKKTLMVICAFLMVTTILFSQEGKPVTVKKKGLSTRYYQDDQRLSGKELRSILKGYPESADEFKIASRNSSMGAILVGGGALVIGASSLINSLNDVNSLNNGDLSDVGKNSPAPYLIGCGMVVAGIPFLLIGNSHFVKSINLYNDQFRPSGKIGASMQFCVGPACLGLKINF